MAKKKQPAPDHRVRLHKHLRDVMEMFEELARQLDATDPLEQNFTVTLLIRHCQSRSGLDKLESFGGKPPANPDKCLDQFGKMAVELEAISVIDETFIVNCLHQAWQRKAAINIEELKATIDKANEEKEVVH
jgi:hypothetical protein